MDGSLDRGVADETIVTEFSLPPSRAGPNEMPVKRPAFVVARPVSPVRRVTHGSPFFEVRLFKNSKNAILAPHWRIELHISILVDERPNSLDISIY